MGETWAGANTEKPKTLDTNTFFKTTTLIGEKGVDVIVYGDSNTGKTFFSMSFPPPIFLIDTEDRGYLTKHYHYKEKDIKIFNPNAIKMNAVSEATLQNPFDMEETVENITNGLIAINQEINSQNLKQGTIVIDSVSDLWTFIQEWMKVRLARKGKLDLDEYRVKNQFDWGLGTGKHRQMIMLMRQVLDSGINLVVTAREEQVPEYVKMSGNVRFEDRMKCQKDVPFYFSSVIHLQNKKVKEGDKIVTKHLAEIEKLETFDYKGEVIENINYDKLITILKKYREGGN